MKNRIYLVTTTSSIDGWEIENYLGIVSYHLVAGTNLFKDMFAGLRDFFGGYSASYQKELDKLEELGLREIKTKALVLGANAIIGLRIDFDEISGGGKSMLMITLSGTAVKVASKLSNEKNVEELQATTISKEEVKYRLFQKDLKEKISNNKFKINKIEDVELLSKYQIFDAIKMVVDSFYIPEINFESNKELFIEYFRKIPFKDLNEFLQNKMKSIGNYNYEYLLEILKEIEWFDYNTIMQLLKSEDFETRNRGMFLLRNEPPTYTLHDIEKLQQLIEIIEKAYSNLPQILVEKSMFGKEKSYWICPNCDTKIDASRTICGTYGCETNIYGFKNNKITPANFVNGLSNRIDLLKSLENLD